MQVICKSYTIYKHIFKRYFIPDLGVTSFAINNINTKMIMDKFIGKLDSKRSGIVYSIFWNPEEKTVWRTRSNDWNEMIGYNASDEISALKTAREFLDLQI